MNIEELENIAEALNIHYGAGELTANHLVNVAVMKNYTPDCPGWCGDIALVVHGSSCFKDILYISIFFYRQFFSNVLLMIKLEYG